jgi:hypothetical protein
MSWIFVFFLNGKIKVFDGFLERLGVCLICFKREREGCLLCKCL